MRAIILSLFALLFAFPQPATAQQRGEIYIQEVRGVWVATQGARARGIGTRKINWGARRVGAGAPSAYEFRGLAPSGPWYPGEKFRLGVFTHENFPIFPPSIRRAALKVIITGVVRAEGRNRPFRIETTYVFEHIETPNDDPYCPLGGRPPCPDLVTPATDLRASQTINIGGRDYVIEVMGFEKLGQSFLTAERRSSSATIVARVSTTAEVVRRQERVPRTPPPPPPTGQSSGQQSGQQ